MSIEGIRLENFRGFSDASIEIKPLTVLLGANSSGKSSFGHALAALAHAQGIYEPSPTLISLTPKSEPESWPVDLGNVSDLRKYGTRGPVYISIKTSEGWVKWGFGLDSEKIADPGLVISYIEQPIPPNGRLVTEQMALPSMLAPAASGSIFTGIAEAHEGQGPVQPVVDAFQRINERDWIDLHGNTGVEVDTRGLMINTVKHSPGGTSWLLNSAVRKEIRDIFKDLGYLRATRPRPARAYREVLINSQHGIGYGGEATARVLHSKAQQKVDIFSPPESVEVTSNGVKHLEIKWTASDVTLIDALSAWLKHLGLAQSVVAVPMPHDPTFLQIRVTLHEQQPHDITEVGFGISQLLPVLVAGLLQLPESIFIVDLPEAHLHPKPQAVLADFFCALALSNRTALVETHSEMFINQLRLRAEMTPGLLEKIAVYFIDEPDRGHCSHPRYVGLRADDQIKWPVGFLEEAWGIESQISAIRNARRKKT